MDQNSESNIEELIIRSLQGRLSRFEEERLRAWRERSAENEAMYQELRELWGVTGTASPLFDASPPDFGSLMKEAEAAEAAEEKRRAGSASKDDPPARRSADRAPAPTTSRSGWLRRTAKALVAASLVGLGLVLGSAGSDGDDGVLARGEIVTGAGEMTTVTLADGSSIRLGPNSRLRLDQGPDQRMAWLDGRAFFGVESDVDRPFTVYTDYGEAVVLGTRFEVRTEEEEFRVLVVEGEVSVAAGGSEVNITEGEMSHSQRGQSPSRERVEDVYQHLDWLGNATVFQDTPLDRAVRELERRYGLEFVLEDPGLGDMTVTAAFTGQPVGDVVFVVCEIVGARCELDGNQVRMRR